jgi:hypothetical protein
MTGVTTTQTAFLSLRLDREVERNAFQANSIKILSSESYFVTGEEYENICMQRRLDAVLYLERSLHTCSLSASHGNGAGIAPSNYAKWISVK